MAADQPRTRLATVADRAPLAAVLSRAFAAEPLLRWIFPDAKTRPRKTARFFALVLDMDLRRNTAFTTQDLGGAALWHAPDAGSGGARGLWAALRFLALLRGDAWRVGRGLAALGSLHPPEPHWYLSYIGTDPDRQGQGVGSALLRPALERCDADGVPAYLVTATGAPFYERHGFEPVGEHLIEGGPLLWRMLRRPA